MAGAHTHTSSRSLLALSLLSLSLRFSLSLSLSPPSRVSQGLSGRKEGNKERERGGVRRACVNCPILLTAYIKRRKLTSNCGRLNGGFIEENINCHSYNVLKNLACCFRGGRDSGSVCPSFLGHKNKSKGGPRERPLCMSGLLGPGFKEVDFQIQFNS